MQLQKPKQKPRQHLTRRPDWKPKHKQQQKQLLQRDSESKKFFVRLMRKRLQLLKPKPNQLQEDSEESLQDIPQKKLLSSEQT